MIDDQARTPTERILDAAAQLFQREGINGTTIEDIATAAGVSRATVYRHIEGGRDEIVLRVVSNAVRDQIRLVIDDILAEHQSFADRVVALLLAIDGILEVDQGQATVFSLPSLSAMVTITGWTDTAVDLVREVGSQLLDDARRTGELDTDISDELVAEWLLRQTVSLRFVSPRAVGDGGLEGYLRRFVVSPLLQR